MYVILENGWKLLRSKHETWTPKGWVQTQDLQLGGKVRSPSGKQFVNVIGFT